MTSARQSPRNNTIDLAHDGSTGRPDFVPDARNCGYCCSPRLRGGTAASAVLECLNCGAAQPGSDQNGIVQYPGNMPIRATSLLNRDSSGSWPMSISSTPDQRQCKCNELCMLLLATRWRRPHRPKSCFWGAKSRQRTNHGPRLTVESFWNRPGRRATSRWTGQPFCRSVLSGEQLERLAVGCWPASRRLSFVRLFQATVDKCGRGLYHGFVIGGSRLCVVAQGLSHLLFLVDSRIPTHATRPSHHSPPAPMSGALFVLRGLNYVFASMSPVLLSSELSTHDVTFPSFVRLRPSPQLTRIPLPTSSTFLVLPSSLFFVACASACSC